MLLSTQTRDGAQALAKRTARVSASLAGHVRAAPRQRGSGHNPAMCMPGDLCRQSWHKPSNCKSVIKDSASRELARRLRWYHRGRHMPRLLLVSNGHGEDAIACRVFDRLLARGLAPETVHAWPAVGEGLQYLARGITCVGASSLLPSAGFATLSAAWMWRDLRAGWIRVHARQIRAAARLRGRYALALAVGDVIPMALAAIARIPFIFVGCAKSVFYGRLYGYTALEVRLLRRHAVETFPRDEPTTAVSGRPGGGSSPRAESHKGHFVNHRARGSR